ncbi:MAG: hypothetical protein ACW991_08890 [Candidatus Hodarchaeales archaeon]|jgi:hypothetical protein
MTKLAWAKAAAEAIITPPVGTTEETTTTTTAPVTAVGILAVLGILSASVLFLKKKR